MATFQDYLEKIKDVKFSEISASYKTQFKLKETMLNASSRSFESIVSKFMEEESAGSKRKWDKQCKLFFVWFLIKYFQSEGKPTINPTPVEWKYFESVLNIDSEMLKGRWITLINQQTKSVTWKPQEDDIVRQLMGEKEQKHIWTQMAVELYNHNNGEFVRTPKQIRERWMNYLNPSLKKDDWTPEEDTALLKMVVQVGKRWSHIAQMIEGRTENQVKNKYKSLLNRILRSEGLDDVDEIKAISDYLNETEHHATLQVKPIEKNDETRPRLKREAKEKQSQYFKLQKEKDELVDKMIEKTQEASIEQRPVKRVKQSTEQKSQPVHVKQKEEQPCPVVTENKPKIEEETPGYRQLVPEQPAKNFQQMDHKMRMCDNQRSPAMMMSETQQIYSQMQQTPMTQGTPMQYTPSDIFKMQMMNPQMLQFGVSPMQSMMSPYQQQGMFYNQLYCQQFMMASPSMMINKSPYRPSDLSPYIQPDYAIPIPTPQRETTQNLPSSYQQMRVNEPEPSFDFLKESNLIGRWKTKRIPDNNA